MASPPEGVTGGPVDSDSPLLADCVVAFSVFTDLSLVTRLSSRCTGLIMSFRAHNLNSLVLYTELNKAFPCFKFLGMANICLFIQFLIPYFAFLVLNVFLQPYFENDLLIHAHIQCI